MGRSRLILSDILHSICETVYFQPPDSINMVYPCIIYKRASEKVLSADNIKYFGMKRYTITVIDRDPDSLIPDKISELPYCSFDTFFVSDNLNHDVYRLYF